MDGASEASPAPPSAPRGQGSRGPGHQGRGRGRGHRGRGRGGPGGTYAQHQHAHHHPNQQRHHRHPSQDAAAEETPANPTAQEVAAVTRPQAPPTEEIPDDAEVCFICANVVAHHSIAPCNHTTCHICGLRMRALYKDKNCAHCRTAAPYVIFADDASKRFEEYTDADFTTTDTNIGIKYAKEDIVGDTVLLLRYNCPDGDCDFAGLGWPDLHRHVKSAHKKRMCDLCTRNKRVFTHEHELFAEKALEKHMRHGDDKPGSADQTGFKGHPLCAFCGERFYDDDKLYEHCRMKHERCFICDRRDSRQPHYYENYNSLEQHFRKDHYLCADRECMEKKFVVFETDMDLQAHKLAEHGGKGGRETRLVDISGFDIRGAYQEESRRGGGAGGRGGGRREGREGREGRGRGRDQNADTPPALSNQPLRRDEIAFQRQMAIHSAQSVSNRTFGGQLTAPAASTTPAGSRGNSGTATPRGNQNANAPAAGSTPVPAAAAAEALAGAAAPVDLANMTPEERARRVRHGATIERASNLLHNDSRKMAMFREHISTYHKGKFTAPQLVDAFFTLFSDTSSNALGTLVREVADLFEDKKKADSLRQAWQDWRAINEDYPSLPGLSGMQGATSASSGWSNAAAANPALPHGTPAQKHSNRVLKLKNSTRLGPAPVTATRGPPGWIPVASSSNSSRPQVASSSAFPTLPSRPAPTTTASVVSSSAASRPSWNTGSAAQVGQSNSSSGASRSRPANSQDNFPALPAAPKPQTTIFGYGSGRGVRRDWDSSRHEANNFQWGGAGASSSSSAPAADGVDEGEGAGGGKKGKKGKKQVLVQWG